MNRSKGNADCHIPNDKYRENYGLMRWNSSQQPRPPEDGVDGTTPDDDRLFTNEDDGGFWD